MCLCEYMQCDISYERQIETEGFYVTHVDNICILQTCIFCLPCLGCDLVR